MATLKIRDLSDTGRNHSRQNYMRFLKKSKMSTSNWYQRVCLKYPVSVLMEMQWKIAGCLNHKNQYFLSTWVSSQREVGIPSSLLGCPHPHADMSTESGCESRFVAEASRRYTANFAHSLIHWGSPLIPNTVPFRRNGHRCNKTLQKNIQ